MYSKSISILVLFTLFLTSCSNQTQRIIVPLNTAAAIEDTYTIIWNGESKAFRYVEGKWERDVSYDYVFDVVQKRYEKTWKSVKNLHRLHPDYDGKAGTRSQSMYFELAYELKNNGLISTLTSSLGNGEGTSDRTFREQELHFELVGISSFAPYSHMTIVQHYDYEAGILTENVELFKLENGKKIPFMKNEEKAYFYIKGKLDDAPTRL